MTIATAPRIESPLPYPSALYIVGANSGKPNPAHERRNVTAASAAAARRQLLGALIMARELT